VFLDEVGDITPALQQRLLRALQEREVRRVGAVHSIRVDVRILAATSRDLMAEVQAGRFRQDLFYRLNVFPIVLPPLRERNGDISLLTQVALERERRRWPGKTSLACSPLTLRILRAYSWPGNVRQLFAAIETAAIRADGDTIEPQHLPREILSGLADDLEDSRYAGRRVGENERQSIVAALQEAGGSRIRAAELLGMGRTTLWRKIKQYRIEEGQTNH
jgi:DNA-binding NtrC family response regulator